MTFDAEELAMFVVNDWNSVKEDVLKLSSEEQHALIRPACRLFAESDPPNEKFAENIGKFLRIFQPDAQVVEAYFAKKFGPDVDPTTIVGNEVIAAWNIASMKDVEHTSVFHYFNAKDLVKILSLTKFMKKQ